MYVGVWQMANLNDIRFGTGIHNQLKNLPLNALEYVIAQVENDSTIPGNTRNIVLSKALKILEDGTLAIEKDIVKRIAFREAQRNGEIKDFILPASTWDCDKTIDYLGKDDYGTRKKVLMCADMGTGKNHYWTNLPDDSEVKFIMLVPYLTIVGQQGSTNKADIDKVLTYDSARTILNMINYGAINPKDKILIIDEAHNFLFSYYRLPAMHSVKALLKYDWKQIIFQSATVRSDSFDDIIDFDVKIRRKTSRDITLSYSRIFQTSPNWQMAEILNEIVRLPKDEKSIVLYNNKSGCEKFAASLRAHGVKVAIVTAVTTKKEGEIAKELAQNSDFCMGDIDVLLGTNSLVEGISIQDNITVGNVFIMDDSSTHPDHIKQVCGRFRKASTVNAIHYCATSKYNIVKNKEKWMEKRRKESITEFYCAKEWIKRRPNGAGIQLSQEMDKDFSTLKDANSIITSVLTRIRNNFSEKNDKGYDESASADFFLSYKPKLESNGIFFDKIKQEYIESNLGDLFAYSDCIRAQFYADYRFANTLMESMGFKIVKRKSIDIDENDVDEIKRNNKNVGDGLRETRKLSAEPILRMIDANEKFCGAMIPVYLMDEGILCNEFQLRIYNVFCEVGDTSKLSKKDLKDAISNMINGQKNDKTIVNKLLASTSEYGIMADLRTKYPPGTILYKQNQIEIIEDTITKMMEHIAIANTELTLKDAFDHLMKNACLDKTKGKISFDNGKVTADLEQPLHILKRFIPNVKGKRKRIDGKKVSLVEVIA